MCSSYIRDAPVGFGPVLGEDLAAERRPFDLPDGVGSWDGRLESELKPTDAATEGADSHAGAFQLTKSSGHGHEPAPFCHWKKA